jgi:hypothetical protein
LGAARSTSDPKIESIIGSIIRPGPRATVAAPARGTAPGTIICRLQVKIEWII